LNTTDDDDDNEKVRKRMRGKGRVTGEGTQEPLAKNGGFISILMQGSPTS